MMNIRTAAVPWTVLAVLAATACQASDVQDELAAPTPIDMAPCERDAELGRTPRDFLVRIHVPPTADRPLFKEGSRVISPGEAPRFQVLGFIGSGGTLTVRFMPIELDGGRKAVETPFRVPDRATLVNEFSFDVPAAGIHDRPAPWTAPFHGRSMCDEVCTFERPCKYMVTFVANDGRRFPDLDPYVVVH
jgi:hypothetical protein